MIFKILGAILSFIPSVADLVKLFAQSIDEAQKKRAAYTIADGYAKSYCMQKNITDKHMIKHYIFQARALALLQLEENRFVPEDWIDGKIEIE